MENVASGKGLQRIVSQRHGFASTHDDDEGNSAADAEAGFDGFGASAEVSADEVVVFPSVGRELQRAGTDVLWTGAADGRLVMVRRAGCCICGAAVSV